MNDSIQLIISTIVLVSTLATVVGYIRFKIDQLIKEIRNSARSVKNSCDTIDFVKLIFGITDNLTLGKEMLMYRLLLIKLLDNIDLAMYHCDEEGKCDYVNRALCRLFKTDPDHMMDFGWLQFVEEDDRQKCLEKWQYAIEKKMPYVNTYVLEDGRELQTKTIMQYDNNGKFVGAAGIVTCVTNSV